MDEPPSRLVTSAQHKPPSGGFFVPISHAPPTQEMPHSFEITSEKPTFSSDSDPFLASNPTAITIPKAPNYFAKK
jgi:hypothetical protein